MAHANNFTIPARLNFRPHQVEWKVCLAEVLGWAEDPPAPPTVIAKSLLGFGGEKVRVTVSVAEPEDDTSGILGALGRYTSHDVEMNRDDLPQEVIASDETRRNSPNISGRTFEVLICQHEMFRSLFPLTKPLGSAQNAWIMRDQFLNLGRDLWDLRLFLNRWGVWSSIRGYERPIFAPSHGFLLIHPHQLWGLQATYRQALTGSARKWLRAGSSLNLIRGDVPPYFFIEVSNCDDAIKATITIDHLSRITFGICQRNDCRRLFEFTTKQRRLYCTPHCAHLANVRKLRAQKKKAAKK